MSMSFDLRVYLPNENYPFFHKNYTDLKEFKEVVSKCQSRPPISREGAILVPARTNTWSNLMQDVFLPSTAYKVKDIFSKQYFYALTEFALNLITSPIRVLSLYPRCKEEATKPECHSLSKYLIENGVSASTLKTDSVVVGLILNRDSENKTEHHLEQKPIDLIETVVTWQSSKIYWRTYEIIKKFPKNAWVTKDPDKFDAYIKEHFNKPFMLCECNDC